MNMPYSRQTSLRNSLVDVDNKSKNGQQAMARANKQGKISPVQLPVYKPKAMGNDRIEEQFSEEIKDKESSISYLK